MNIAEIVKRNESLNFFSGRWRERKDICVDFELCLNVHSLISIQHKSIKLGQMIKLNVVLHPGGGSLPEKLGRGVRPAAQNRYPIYDQNLQFSLPFL